MEINARPWSTAERWAFGISFTIFALSLATVLQAQTFVNGGFSDLTTGWTGCLVEVNSSTTYGGPDADYVAEVDGDVDPGTTDDRLLCQTVSGFTVGVPYTLEFDATRRPGLTPASVSVTVLIDGNALETIVTRTGDWNMQHEVFTFTATQTSHTLTISPNFQGSLGMILDNFQYGVSTLPVELVRFDAEVGSDGVRLDWTTATEFTNAYFVVERSRDLQGWASMAIVAGAGNSPVPLDYSVLDAQPHLGLSYYRLRQVDMDGTSSLSDVKSVLYSGFSEVPLWPNPAVDRIHLVGLDGGSAGAEIIDGSGRVVPVAQVQEDDRVVLHVGALPAGHYHVRGTADGAWIGRFIKP